MLETSPYERWHRLMHRIVRPPVCFEGSDDWKLSWDGEIGHLHVAVDKQKVDWKWEASVAMFVGDVCRGLQAMDMKPRSHETMQCG